MKIDIAFRVLSPVNSLKILADADQMFDDTCGWDYSYKSTGECICYLCMRCLWHPFKLCTKYDHIDTICLKISIKIELASIPIL